MQGQFNEESQTSEISVDWGYAAERATPLPAAALAKFFDERRGTCTLEKSGETANTEGWRAIL